MSSPPPAILDGDDCQAEQEHAMSLQAKHREVFQLQCSGHRLFTQQKTPFSRTRQDTPAAPYTQRKIIES